MTSGRNVVAQSRESLREMSSTDFAAFGLQELAYVKQVEMSEQPVYAIHGADGTALTAASSREIAFALVRQNDLEPLSVH